MELLEFYPTPETLLDKILDGVDYRYIGTVLEPSAGKGDIVKYIEKVAGSYPHYNSRITFDCIELDETLQKTLIGQDMRVVHDNFLTYKTNKTYDLIIANPPFSEGDKHLMKALDMQEKSGGDVVFILNAETIRNPYANLRKALVDRLEKAGASIEYMQQEFSSAERQTNVEIAVVKVHYDKPEYTSDILDGLKKKYYSEGTYQEDITDLAPNDFIEAIVKRYEIEVEAGIRLIREYRALAPRLLDSLDEEYSKYSHPILELKSNKYELSINSFVEQERMKYWSALFKDKRITGQMTSNLQTDFLSKVNELKDYEFSVYNIKQMQIKMNQNLVKGIEDCIIELFDELSHQYSWYDSSNNIHYYNGWKTNSAWKINKKVIIPFYADVWSRWGSKEYQPDNYSVVEKISDIEKALNYLDGGLTDGISVFSALSYAKRTGQTKNIRLKYFDITFYKKGTCHIVFRDEELLKKFNIFGSQKKGWLPQDYGKKMYSEMNAEEKAVIDDFEGEASYNKTMANTSYYLFDANNVALLEDKSA
ncbi:MAG: DUF4942 domain-containing protein [Butyrivibrio sp.]|uniref:DUF4942 domain-containing protein n=1 Tax=Butyrivibrio sp. TaxID=28121 RepID=UPI001B45A981|nr:DUF4942 domain-containing protein [Butyrivibrio sp.]MBP3784424.1 DUF4942 domain-containing protein [Butyrivibrio sp.]